MRKAAKWQIYLPLMRSVRIIVFFVPMNLPLGLASQEGSGLAEPVSDLLCSTGAWTVDLPAASSSQRPAVESFSGATQPSLPETGAGDHPDDVLWAVRCGLYGGQSDESTDEGF